MFEAILSAMRDGVMVLDAGGKIIYANQALADIFSSSLPQIIGKRLLEVARLVELDELVNAARSGAKGIEKEIQFFYPLEKFFFCSAGAISDVGVVVVLRDMSETRKLENLRREFAASVSHELKTPLTAIRGYTETLLGGAVDDPAHNRRFLEKIDRNARELSSLIDDILEISSLEARRGVPPFLPVEVGGEISRAIEALSDKARSRKIEIVKLPMPPGVKVTGDAGQIYRALLNLLDNAIAYSNAGGRVEIGSAVKDQKAEITVRDYGIGIPAEHLPRIFERFYRADKARSREGGGTGLGLSIVKHIMEIHGGEVTVESEVGKGSVFTLVFQA